MKSLYIFDLDDTLIETRKAYLSSYVDLISAVFALPQDYARKTLVLFLMHYSSSDAASVFQAYCYLLGKQLQGEQETNFVQQFEHLYWQRLALYPGAEQFLTDAKYKGRQLSLVSNGKSDIQRKKIAQLGLEAYFEPSLVLISGDFEASAKKPSPYMHQHLLQMTGKKQAEAVYFGNTWQDALSAQKAGVDFVYFYGSKEDERQAVICHGFPSFEKWEGFSFEALLAEHNNQLGYKLKP